MKKIGYNHMKIILIFHQMCKSEEE